MGLGVQLRFVLPVVLCVDSEAFTEALPILDKWESHSHTHVDATDSHSDVCHGKGVAVVVGNTRRQAPALTRTEL